MHDPFSDIIGHRNAIARLRNMADRGLVPHAVLLHGPRHLGKRALAFALAEALLGGRPSAHPDLRVVERGRDEKTGKLRKLIGVDDVRELRTHLSMSSLAGGRKVAVIDEAELLSDGAANALLKAIEEPPEGTHVVLVAHDAGRLLPTVRSRAAEVPLARVTDAVLREALESRGAAREEADALTRYAAGRPGVALTLRDDPDMLHWYEEQEGLWRSLRREPLHRRFALLAPLSPPRADREETAGRVLEALALWETFVQRELRRGSSDAAAVLRHIAEVRESLAANVQPRLLLERFALRLEERTSDVNSHMLA